MCHFCASTDTKQNYKNLCFRTLPLYSIGCTNRLFCPKFSPLETVLDAKPVLKAFTLINFLCILDWDRKKLLALHLQETVLVYTA